MGTASLMISIISSNNHDLLIFDKIDEVFEKYPKVVRLHIEVPVADHGVYFGHHIKYRC